MHVCASRALPRGRRPAVRQEDAWAWPAGRAVLGGALTLMYSSLRYSFMPGLLLTTRKRVVMMSLALYPMSHSACMGWGWGWGGGGWGRGGDASYASSKFCQQGEPARRHELPATA